MAGNATDLFGCGNMASSPTEHLEGFFESCDIETRSCVDKTYFPVGISHSVQTKSSIKAVDGTVAEPFVERDRDCHSYLRGRRANG